MQYIECEKCGAHLDIGEKCDCEKKQSVSNAADVITVENTALCTANNEPLIMLEQLPIITAHLQELAQEIDAKVDMANSLVVTAKSKQAAKELKSSLNKERDYYELVRKQIRKSILQPYDTFNAEYDRIIKGKYDTAEQVLKEKITSIESAEISKKETDLQEYFKECAESLHLDFVTFEQMNFKINLTVTLTALKKECKERMDGIAADVAAISGMAESMEILVEYKKNFNLAESVSMVSARHKAIEDEQKRMLEIAAQEQLEFIAAAKVDSVVNNATACETAVQADEPLQAPIVTPLREDAVMSLSFKVIAPISKLKILKQYLIDGGFNYEPI
ncbi:MAG: DUF1351 domain-containing protein [Oscillospiraceae bacterium]